MEKTCRAGPWNEAESEFEGAEDVCQAACGDSSSAAASKRVSSGSKVSNKAMGEMKEEKKGAVLCQVWEYVVCCPQFLS